ncbi:transcriptional regulator, TetR family [Ruminococcaceae bacterium FB2012]|nr:transcriptional regulator, TetR family [Ruminococcaceae bacterium FB2012]
MSINNESREKLIECAKKEFLEKGFVKASLRNICSQAGLTTGAVYFLFNDKNGLFEAVVSGALGEFTQLMQTHLAEEINADISTYTFVPGEHDEFARQLVSLLYSHYDEMMILLEKSQGSQFENLPDKIIEMLDAGYLRSAQKYADSQPGKRVNRYMLHWLSHIQVDAFIHLLTHEKDRNRAEEKIKPVLDMLVKSWLEFVLEDDK